MHRAIVAAAAAVALTSLLLGQVHMSGALLEPGLLALLGLSFLCAARFANPPRRSKGAPTLREVEEH